MSARWTDRQFSLEFYPPKTTKGVESFHRNVRRLEALGPAFASVTFGAGGTTRERTFETVEWLQQHSQMEAVPHISCIGSIGAHIGEILARYRDGGVRRVVALRGDIPEGESDVFPDGAFRHANELVEFVRDFGGFEIYVACYPEFHPEAPDPKTDLENFARKVRAGADFAVTQYFFDNTAYFRFVEDAQRLGVEIPILVGLMPIWDFDQISRFSAMCGAGIPRWIRQRMEGLAGDREAQRELAIDIATRQADELLANGCPGIHFYTLNRATPILRIWENLGLATAAPAVGAAPTVEASR